MRGNEDAVRNFGEIPTAHEMAPAIDQVAGEIPIKRLNTEIRQIYNALNIGTELTQNGADVLRELMRAASQITRLLTLGVSGKLVRGGKIFIKQGVYEGAAFESRSPRSYNPPVREKEDYSNGAQAHENGRHLADFDGRPFVDRAYVARRRRAEGVDKTITPADYDGIAKKAVGAISVGVAPRSINNDAGRLVKTIDRRSGHGEYDILFDKALASDKRDRVTSHEVPTLILNGEVPR